MIRKKMSLTPHEWEKQNTVTLQSRTKGYYDIYRCKHCGIEGRSYSIGLIDIPERYAKRVDICTRQRLGKFLKVTHCNAYGNQFENLTDGSVHPILDPPEGQDNQRGEWVMGNGEPVLLLYNEFKHIEQYE